MPVSNHHHNIKLGSDGNLAFPQKQEGNKDVTKYNVPVQKGCGMDRPNITIETGGEEFEGFVKQSPQSPVQTYLTVTKIEMSCFEQFREL